MVIAALVGSNLAMATVLLLVARRANTLEQSLQAAQRSNEPREAELVFIEGNGVSLLHRETMRASAIAARSRARAAQSAEPSTTGGSGDVLASAATPEGVATTTLSKPLDNSGSAPASNERLVQLLVAFDRASAAGDDPMSLDGQLDLVEQAALLSASERTAIADKLRSLAADGRIPALFLLARLHERAGEHNDAARWFLTANIVRIIDTRRFKQAPEQDATLRVTELFGAVQDNLRQNAPLRRSAVEFALDLEEAMRDRPPAAWLLGKPGVSHAMLADLCLDEDQWRAAREAVRRSLAPAIRETTSQSEPANPLPGPQAAAWRTEVFGQSSQAAPSALASQPEETP